MINIDDFKKIEIRVGLVVAAIDQPGSEKLIKLSVNFGPTSPEATKDVRTIFTAVRPYGYTAEYFVNKKWVFVTNLEPKKIMNEQSQGMILAVDSPEGKPIFLVPEKDAEPGARVR